MAIAKEQIRTWLNGDRNYAEGVKLYAQYGDILQLKKLFGEGYHKEKLFQELVRTFRAMPEEKSEEKKPDHIPDVRKVIEKEDPTAADFIAMKQKGVAMFKEQASLHQQLELPHSEESRLEKIKRIMELDGQLTRIWDQLDFYRENKCFLPDQISLPENATPVMIIQIRNNVRSQLSKLKRRLQAATNDEEKEKLEYEIMERKKILQSIKIKLQTVDAV